MLIPHIILPIQQISMLTGVVNLLKCGRCSKRAVLDVRNITIFSSQFGKRSIPKQQLVTGESALMLTLAKHPTVRLQTEGLPNVFRDKFPSSLTDPMCVEVDSDKLKLLLQQTGCNILLVEEGAQGPLFSVRKQTLSTSSENPEADKSITFANRNKIVQLNANIDDHMLQIRVKQTKEFLEKGYPVSVVVRLPLKALYKLTKPGTVLSEEEKQRMRKVMYDSSRTRFLEAFKDCSAKAPKILPSTEFKELLFSFSTE